MSLRTSRAVIHVPQLLVCVVIPVKLVGVWIAPCFLLSAEKEKKSKLIFCDQMRCNLTIVFELSVVHMSSLHSELMLSGKELRFYVAIKITSISFIRPQSELDAGRNPT